MARKMITGWFLPLALSGALLLNYLFNAEWFQRQLGTVFPVVSSLEITSVEPTDVDGVEGVKITGDATKLHNCTYEGIDWYLGSPYGVPITAKFLDSPKQNQKGRIHWTNLLVGITPERLSETYGEVIHSCYGVVIRTPFYVTEYYR